MKLWLDDIRSPLEHTGDPDWVWCKTVEEAMETLEKSGAPLVASLDYQLHWMGIPPTGMDLLRWMRKNNIKPDEIRVHSTHPTGRKAMLQFIKEWYR